MDRSEAAASPWASFDFSGSLAEVVRRTQVAVEKRKIELALREAQGNKGGAADLLGIPYKALLGKLKEHGLDVTS